MLPEQFGRLAIKAHQVSYHADKARRQQIDALTEQGIQRGRVVFQTGSLVVNREAHGRRLRLYAELAQEPGEEWIVPRVVHDESSIDAVT